MLTSILERNSWIIYKFGMPLVYFYHLVIASVFLNTAAEDSHGLEKCANVLLAPMQYFFEGKKAIPITLPDGSKGYSLERRFDYNRHFFVKTAVATIALPISIAAGSTVKSLAYLSPETRERSHQIDQAMHSTKVDSNKDYYLSVGMQVENYKEAEMIAPPKWNRNPNIEDKLAKDLEGLKEIVRILSKYEIPFWIDCGTCLGCYQYGKNIPNDWDIDVAILAKDFDNIKSALQELDPKKFVVQDWSGRAQPKTYLKVFIRETGGMIDLYNFGIDEEKKQVFTILSNRFNIFSPSSWIQREMRYTIPMSFETVFPLKKALFEGIEVPVPGNIEKYLQTFYGENLAPAKIYNELTGKYEKDLSHPYWQIPNVH